MPAQYRQRNDAVPRDRMRSRGAALVEFAFILPVLLVLLYGILVYSIVLVTQQAVAYGAERGAEAAVAANPDLADGSYLAAADQLAKQEIQAVIGFLPGGFSIQVELTAPAGSGLGQELRVTVQYPFANWGLPAPTFLPLPDTLTGVGVLRVRT